MFLDRSALRLPVVLVVAASLGLSGCVTTNAASENLTPAQRELRQQSERFNETVAVGAAAGAILGCALGAAINRNNRAGGCAAGGVLGGVAGAGSGYYIATRNQQFATREQAAQARADAARREADDLSRTADVAERVARENKEKIASLDERYRKRQITAEQYRAQTLAMREDTQAMKRASENAGKVSSQMAADSAGAGTGSAEIREQAVRAAKAKNNIDAAVAELEAALARVPTA